MVRSAAAPTSPGTPQMTPLYAGVLLVAMSALLLEIVLTRVFAVLMWHHFAYMIVSLALLGFGASGSLLTALRIDRRRGAVSDRLALFATTFGVLVVLSFLLVTKIRVDSIELLKEPRNFFGLMLAYLVLSLPFLFCGLTIGASLAWFPQRVGALYGVDLVGAALGAAAAPWLLGRLRTDAAVMVAALLALAAGAVFAWNAGRGRRIAHALPVAAGLVLVVAFAGGGLGIPPLHWRIPFAPHKMFVKLYFPDGESEATLPSATAQVDVSESLRRPMRMAADFGEQERQVVTMRGVTQDGTAPTVLYEDASDIGRFTSLDDSQAATAFLAYAATGRKAPEVLVIGVGGGVDVMMALYFGAEKVTAVEINKAMIDMVTREYAGFIGNLFDDPRVHLVREEGRAFLKRSDDRYDIIQLSGTDTFAALTSGAYTLHESYVYTVEAVMDMYSRLAEGGYINYSRAILASPTKPPRETLRLANVARTALERLGVAEPWRNLAVFQGVRWASTIIRKGPFTAAEIDALREFAQRENFLGFVFDPLRAPGEPMGNAEEFYVNAVLEKMSARGDPGPEALTARRASILEAVRPQLEYRQRVLDYYRTVVRGPRQAREEFVSEYLFDLRPPSDDKPFFFDYFKARRFFDYARDAATFNEILPEFPVGHAVLVSSLAQILFWAALLILLPLRALPRAEAGGRLRWRAFAYFAALGLGFMFAEISLMQKFTLFLGDPTYSLSVVLGGILLFAGLGALCSSRVREVTRRVATAVLGGIVVLLILDWLGIGWILAETMRFERGPRILIALLVLAPTAFALGMPFPFGIRLLEKRAPALIPWGWAVNGFLSVAGSLLAVMLAMACGFSAALLAGAVIYSIALLVVPAS